MRLTSFLYYFAISSLLLIPFSTSTPSMADQSCVETNYIVQFSDNGALTIDTKTEAFITYEGNINTNTFHGYKFRTNSTLVAVGMSTRNYMHDRYCVSGPSYAYLTSSANYSYVINKIDVTEWLYIDCQAPNETHRCNYLYRTDENLPFNVTKDEFIIWRTAKTSFGCPFPGTNSTTLDDVIFQVHAKTRCYP